MEAESALRDVGYRQASTRAREQSQRGQIAVAFPVAGGVEKPLRHRFPPSRRWTRTGAPAVRLEGRRLSSNPWRVPGPCAVARMTKLPGKHPSVHPPTIRTGTSHALQLPPASAVYSVASLRCTRELLLAASRHLCHASSPFASPIRKRSRVPLVRAQRPPSERRRR